MLPPAFEEKHAAGRASCNKLPRSIHMQQMRLLKGSSISRG
jgi:hypothetical protein